MLRNSSGHSSQSGSAFDVRPSASVGNCGGRALRIPAGLQSVQVDRTTCDVIPPLNAITLTRSTAMPARTVGNGGSLTRSVGKRRRPPPPPPRRTSSVQSSPALSCRSEQLTRRGLPPPPPRPPAASGDDRLTPLPTPPSSLSRSALIRPGALRSSFTGANEPTTASPPSPDWNFRRSHSLTESATAATATRTNRRRPSLLSTIGSRLRSYWSPSAHRRDRPATASGDYRRPSLELPSQYSVASRPGGGEVLLPDDDDEETYVSFDVLKSRHLPPSPTMSSFSSFTGDS